MMMLSDFRYDLPKELIAQEALPKRSDAKLLLLDRATGTLSHQVFRSIVDFFQKGDILVLNDTRVIPARLFAKKKTGGRVELLLLKKESPSLWQVLLRPSGRIKEGEMLTLEGDATAVVLDEADHKTGIRHVQFAPDVNADELIERIGRLPLPPYIDREEHPMDRELYQTVFARNPGAVAAPTAGLHFDELLLSEIERKGVRIVYLTLHVGYGTFQPVHADDLARHEIHEEYFEVPDQTAEVINFAKMDGRRVIACGTTAVRALESAAVGTVPPELRAKAGMTKLFIYPPYEFKIVDAMITNFHLPETTLLMLVSAFAGYETLMKAYQEAIAKKYRFYSYGDAMLIY